MSDMQKFWSTVVGGGIAILLGVLGVAGDPPILALGDQLAVALIIAGLAVLGVGPIRSAYSAAKAS